jgi:hypothetical protein
MSLPSPVDQDAEVAKLLGDLMSDGNEPSHDSDADVEEEGASDREPPHEVVQRAFRL